jgi:CubicO group peptidase (beta-lactamase class C family)
MLRPRGGTVHIGSIIVVLGLAACQPPPAADSLDLQVAPIVDRMLRDTPIAGISVAIGRNGEVTFARGFGLSELASRQPLNAAAVMDIGSIGKQFTAAAVLKLVERGQIDLDQPATRYLPAWNDGGFGVTVRQLLNHTSGLDDPPFSEEEPEPRFLAPAPPDGLLAFANTARLRFAVHETWYYANTGYHLLGIMLEHLHRKPYGRVIEDEIARPLALGTLVHCDKKRAIPNRAHDYMIRLGAPELVPAIDVSWFGGAGSLCASASDLVRWEDALWSGKVVTPPLLEIMNGSAPIKAAGAALDVPYGFGRAHGTIAGHRKFGHPGTGAGISGALTHFPDDGLILAVLVNTNGRNLPHARSIEAQLAAEILGLHPAVEAPAVPIPADRLDAWPGTYAGGFGVGLALSRCEGDGLCAASARGGAEPRRLRYRGNGLFAGTQGPGSELQFVPADGPPVWVVHTLDGLHDNVLRRINAP